MKQQNVRDNGIIRKQSGRRVNRAAVGEGSREEGRGCLIRKGGGGNEPRSPLRYSGGYLRGGRSVKLRGFVSKAVTV